MTGVPQIEVEQLHRRLERGDDIVVLDVREPPEWSICRIEGSLHLPLSELRGRFSEIPTDREIVVVCHHGDRSELLAHRLRELGFERVANLRGGVDAWARRVDPTMSRY